MSSTDHTVHRLKRPGHYSYRGIKFRRQGFDGYRTITTIYGHHTFAPKLAELKASIDRQLDGPATT